MLFYLWVSVRAMHDRMYGQASDHGLHTAPSDALWDTLSEICCEYQLSTVGGDVGLCPEAIMSSGAAAGHCGSSARGGREAG